MYARLRQGAVWIILWLFGGYAKRHSLLTMVRHFRDKGTRIREDEKKAWHPAVHGLPVDGEYFDTIHQRRKCWSIYACL